MEDSSIWDNPEEAQKKMKLLASLKSDVSGYQQLVSDRDDIRDMIEMADEEPDESLIPEVQEMFADFKERFDFCANSILPAYSFSIQSAISSYFCGLSFASTPFSSSIVFFN